jgi:hypothetical protein
VTQARSSLQQALYEPALDYYTAHSKRVRRKRNRHSQVTTYPNAGVLGSTGITRPLRPEGWTVRYECKMACFAEFRGEDEVALKSVLQFLSIYVFAFPSYIPYQTLSRCTQHTYRYVWFNRYPTTAYQKMGRSESPCRLYQYQSAYSPCVCFYSRLTCKLLDCQIVSIQQRTLTCARSSQYPHAVVQRLLPRVGHRGRNIRVLELDGKAVGDMVSYCFLICTSQ